GARHAHGRHLVAVHVLERLPAEGDRALLRLVHAVDAIEHRALAGAVRPDDRADLMLAHVERNIREGLHATERERDVLDVEDDLARFSCRLRDDGGIRHGVHAAAFTGSNSLVSTMRSVADTTPVRPSSNFTCVSMYCSVLPSYSA